MSHKKLVTKQFKVKGNAKLDNAINKFCKSNEIELADISQLNFSTDHSSALLVFLTDKDNLIDTNKDDPEEEK